MYRHMYIRVYYKMNVHHNLSKLINEPMTYISGRGILVIAGEFGSFFDLFNADMSLRLFFFYTKYTLQFITGHENHTKLFKLMIAEKDYINTLTLSSLIGILHNR